MQSPDTRQSKVLLQPRILRLGLLQNGDVRVGVFLEREEILAVFRLPLIHL